MKICLSVPLIFWNASIRSVSGNIEMSDPLGIHQIFMITSENLIYVQTEKKKKVHLDIDQGKVNFFLREMPYT